MTLEINREGTVMTCGGPWPRDRFAPTVLLENDIATHSNGCPLDLARLVQADDFNILHDVVGISKYIDTETGRLTQCFLPRFAKQGCAV